jgi:hypothetical protein
MCAVGEKNGKGFAEWSLGERDDVVSVQLFCEISVRVLEGKE